MKIGLIDVDNYEKLHKCFPNLALMKISAYHKANGDEVLWYQPMFTVYILCNYDSTMEQNLERIQFCRELDFSPYVMLYNKQDIPKGHELRKLQRWVNNRWVFWSCETFEEYMKGKY